MYICYIYGEFLCIWIRKLVLKEFWMVFVLYKRHEREVLK